MPKKNIVITLGVLVALLPVFGFPRAWESFFQVIVGVSLIMLSIWSTIDKKLTLKAKAQRRQAEKQQEIETAEEQTGEERPSDTNFTHQDSI